MPDMVHSIQINSLLGLLLFLIVWIVLFKVAHLFVLLLRHEPLIGWAISPLGITLMALHEPSTVFIWLDVLIPALISGGTLYIGLFTSLSPITLQHYPLLEWVMMAVGICCVSMGDLITALQDLRHPLWGEARILRSLQILRATSARIHFTPFGYSYLADHFGATPRDLLQAL